LCLNFDTRHTHTHTRTMIDNVVYSHSSSVGHEAKNGEDDESQEEAGWAVGECDCDSIAMTLVVKLIVAAHRDQRTESSSQSEQDLHRSVTPHLQSMSCCSFYAKWNLRKAAISPTQLVQVQPTRLLPSIVSYQPLPMTVAKNNMLFYRNNYMFISRYYVFIVITWTLLCWFIALYLVLWQL